MRRTMKINESYLARRRFLCGMVGGGAAALGAASAVPLVAYVGNLRDEPLPDSLVLEQADYELAPGTSKIVMYGRIPALLIQTPEPESELEGVRGHLHAFRLHGRLRAGRRTASSAPATRATTTSTAA